jgi:hypothetical protein
MESFITVLSVVGATAAVFYILGLLVLAIKLGSKE